MLDDKEKLLKKNTLFTIRRNRKQSSAYEKARNICFVLSIFLCLFLIAGIYLLTPFSDIYRIAVTGNRYLTREDIIGLSGLSEKSKYLLCIPMQVENKIKKDPLIKNVKVRRLEGRLVQIEVEEKKIVGYAPENGLNVLLLEDGEKAGIGKDRMYLIAYGPFVEGYEGEDQVKLIKQLAKCDAKIIEQISEIHHFPQLKYQDVEVIMRDGNYVFTSVYGMEILNHYFDMESSYASGKDHCYYFEDISGNAYTSACPWEEVIEAPAEEETPESSEE
ncbi:MAG: FtsQ-type POTRA domain-containing protein [Erysipelotrichaceae bacterium]|nr:FtsQ-type POTRA domain-containing protein [Erysipelotrichaceae bacterium]